MNLKQLTYGSLFCGIEHSSKLGKEVLYGLLLKKKKNEFDLESSFESENTEGLKEILTKHQAVFISINNEQVLFKQLDKAMSSPQKAVAMAFPNIPIDDFYFEVLGLENKTYVALCRKEVVETIIESYTKNQYHIVGFSLGNLAIGHLAGFVDVSELQTTNGLVQFSSAAISDISIGNIESESYQINGLDIENTGVLSLAGILSYYTNQTKTVVNFSERCAQLKNRFEQEHLFFMGLKGGLAILFIALFISFLFFSNYTTKIDALSADLVLNKSQKNNYLNLSEEVAKKEKRIQDFSTASSKASWYLDQIALGIPNSIALEEIHWQPLLKTIKEEEEIQLHQKIILIKGISKNADEFSNWMQLIEEQEWLIKATIKEYGAGKKTSTSFELELEIKE